MKYAEEFGFCRWGVLGQEVGRLRDRFCCPEAGCLTFLPQLGTEDPDFLDGFEAEISHIPKGLRAFIARRLRCTKIELQTLFGGMVNPRIDLGGTEWLVWFLRRQGHTSLLSKGQDGMYRPYTTSTVQGILPERLFYRYVTFA
jgi:hypothetical protein